MLTLTSLEMPPQYERPRVYGARVKDARILEGLKAGDVATRIGMGVTRYSRLESSDAFSPIDVDELTKLSEVLGFDEEYFSSPPVTVVERSALCFRAKKSMTKTQEDEVAAWARICGDLLHGVLRETGELVKLSLPQTSSDFPPDEAAHLAREALGVRVDAPIAQLMRALERAGVFIFSAEFAAEGVARHDAVSLWVGEARQRPVVLVRDIESWERTRMSMAHEVGHLVLHRYAKPENAEEAAFAFAAEFLMPGDSIKREWPAHATLESLLPLKMRWGVSISALIEQGHRLGLMTPERRRSLYKQLSTRRQYPSGKTWREQEPGFDRREVEKPLLITRLIERAYDKNINIETLRRKINSWPARFLAPLVDGQFRAPAILPSSITGVNLNVTSIFSHSD